MLSKKQVIEVLIIALLILMLKNAIKEYFTLLKEHTQTHTYPRMINTKFKIVSLEGGRDV